MRILNRVTITGADDDTNIEDMVHLSEEYPWIEWGILLHPNRMGTRRYPSEAWLRDVCQAKLCLSGHLCARWARRCCKGEWLFHSAYSELVPAFSRWQLNIAPYYQTISSLEGFLAALPNPTTETIFGAFDERGLVVARWVAERAKASVLWDCSGGQGILKEWPVVQHERHGYAGGLTPDNLQAQLEAMSRLAGNESIWVDVESGVRTSTDEFDFYQVESFIQAAATWVREDWKNVR